MFILLFLHLTHGSNVGDLSAPVSFVRRSSVVLMGFSGALGCSAAVSANAFQTNACEKWLKTGGDTRGENGR